ncbi:MAG: PAS domain S-box protein [Candidatus Riflebacteria bacterium]|nr:PAS domain S-box protein [Candidatus Riflebacteria bacterium]
MLKTTTLLADNEAGAAAEPSGTAKQRRREGVTTAAWGDAVLGGMEAELKEAQRLAHIGSWYWDAKTDVVVGSDELLRIYGFDPSTQTMPNLRDQRGRCYPVEDWEQVDAAVRRTVETGAGYELTVRALRNASTIWITTRGEAVREPGGRVVGLRGTVQDVTERRTAEVALRQSEGRYRVLFDSMSEGFALHEIVTDAQGRPCDYVFLDLNPAFERLTGLKRADVIGRRVLEVLPGTEPHWIESYGHVALTGEPAHFENRHAGLGRWYEVIAYRPAPAQFAAVFTDITERKQAEEALRESEARLRALAEALPQIVWTGSADGSIEWFNQHWYEYTGAPQGVGEGWSWDRVTHPDDLPRTVTAWQAACERGGLFQNELRLRGRDGRYRWFLVRAWPLRDAGGKVLRWFGTNTDVQEMKAARAAAEAANEAKSRFLANMSHELRTPMNAILGMIDVALPRATDPIMRDCLQTAKGSADLLLTVLNDLLDSASIESGKLRLEPAAFSLRRMLDQIFRVLSAPAEQKGLTFRCRVSEGTPDAVLGDRTRLQQVLLNLTGNAIKFTERGEVELCLRATRQDGHTDLEFAVRDTGIGLPPADQERLFQPFGQADASRTRRFGGTGLGLSICKSLVDLMKGRIWVESEPGKGTTFSFSVRLPLAQGPLPETKALPEAPTTTHSGLRVLLVEDNPANRKLASYILKHRGHTVEAACDGREALRLTEKVEYDVILMDVQMPGMDGLEATAAIRKREAGVRRVPIVAMTAHAMKDDCERCLEAGMDGYLAKPVNAKAMIDLVESLARGDGSGAQVGTAQALPAQPPCARQD